MSGHSKWSTIKRKKGATDAKRGKIFSRLAKEITIAAKMGSGDVESNPRLRVAVSKAKEVNMPSDNVKKAIQRGTGELPGVSYEDVMYEGYGPGGIAVVIEAVTDNKNRTTAEVKSVFTKNNGNMAERGAVTWNFKRKGLIIIPADGKTEEEIFEIIMEAGAADFEIDGDDVIIKTEFEDLESVRKSLEESGIEIKDSDLTLIPDTYNEVDKNTAEKNLRLVEALEDLDDVNRVTTNMDIPEELMQEM